MWERKYCGVKRERNILHAIQRRQGRWIRLIWRRNYLLIGVVGGKMGHEDEEEDVKGYWMNVMTREVTGN
jgi:hypothetical protein